MEYAYIGSFTTKKRGGLEQGGISVFTKNKAEDTWQQIQIVNMVNPSFLAFGFNKHVLYAAQGDGCVITAFTIDEASGMIKFLNEKNIGFFNSVSLVVDKKSNFLFVACLNNGHGAVVTLKLKQDGSIGDICNIYIPQGETGPLHPAQAGPQPHQVKFDLTNDYLIVCDKGLDQVSAFEVDYSNGALQLVSSTKFPMSSCPRHIAFHPNKPLAFLLTEWIGGVIPCNYSKGNLTLIEVQKTVPKSYVGLRNVAAEIEIHPSGKFLYASNRGHNSLVAFKILDSGCLEAINWYHEGIDKPRFFAITKDGKYIYCANEGSHSITLFSVSEDTGRLTFLNTIMKASAPGCILLKNS